MGKKDKNKLPAVDNSLPVSPYIDPKLQKKVLNELTRGFEWYFPSVHSPYGEFIARWYLPNSFKTLLNRRDNHLKKLKNPKETFKDILKNKVKQCEVLLSIIRDKWIEHDLELIDEMKTFKPYKDTSGKQHKKRGDIALFHGKNIEWEKVIISLPAKEWTASYELRVRIKGKQRSEPFGLKEFGFWNLRGKKPTMLFVTLQALANVKSTIGHEGNKDEMRRFGKSVSALGKLLNRQLGINGSPFNTKELHWTPKFKIEIEKDEDFISRDSKTVHYGEWMSSEEDLMN
jgi:hypothetical protein